MTKTNKILCGMSGVLAVAGLALLAGALAVNSTPLGIGAGAFLVAGAITAKITSFRLNYLKENSL